MSEYQFYAFQAIDRRLTDQEMAELRSVSSRGRITSTSFTNESSWGDFKGNPDVWMEKYFDAFLYLANWGTHVFKLRLSARLLDLSTARLYCVGDSASAREKDGNVILHFGSDEQPKSYDQAVELVADLRDLAPRQDSADFRRRVEALRLAHARKPTLIERPDKAGL
jgi:hypothetical protein